MPDVIAHVILSVGSAIFGLCVVIALGRWGPARSRWNRVICSMIASVLPVFLLAVCAFAWSGINPLSMSLDEFWIPFVIQVSMIVALSLPLVWFGSRWSRSTDGLATAFD